MFQVLSKNEIKNLSNKAIVKYCADLQLRKYENEDVINELLEIAEEEIERRFKEGK